MNDITEESGKIREAALRILDYGDNTHAQLVKKLVQKGFSEERAEEAVSELSDSGLVDDVRYAEAFVRIKTEAGKGPAWIRKKLSEKGVDRRIIDSATAVISERGSQRRVCIAKALDACGLKHDFEVLDDGRVRAREGSAYEFERVRYFDDPDAGDRLEAYRQRDREKARLARRLASAGFAQDAVMHAVKLIESL